MKRENKESKILSLESIVKKHEYLAQDPSLKAIRSWKRPNCSDPTDEVSVYKSIQDSNDESFFDRVLNIVSPKK